MEVTGPWHCRPVTDLKLHSPAQGMKLHQGQMSSTNQNDLRGQVGSVGEKSHRYPLICSCPAYNSGVTGRKSEVYKVPPALVANCTAKSILQVTQENSVLFLEQKHPSPRTCWQEPAAATDSSQRVTGSRGPGRRLQLINATSEGTGDQISSNIFRLIVKFLHFHPSSCGFYS